MAAPTLDPAVGPGGSLDPDPARPSGSPEINPDPDSGELNGSPGPSPCGAGDSNLARQSGTQTPCGSTAVSTQLGPSCVLIEPRFENCCPLCYESLMGCSIFPFLLLSEHLYVTVSLQ